MNEGIPHSEYSNERILSDAYYVVDALWEKVMNVDDLPLSVDPSYESWSRDIELRKNEYARALFEVARKNTGDDAFRAAKTLKRLVKLLNNEQRGEVFRELMTTEEAVKQLATSREEEVIATQPKKEKLRGKITKFLDRFFMRDDDFDDRL